MASLRSFLDQQVRLLSQPLTVPPDFNTHPAVKKINEKHPDSDPIPIAVIQATVSKVNSDLEAARKLKLTKKSTASVLEQLHAVQREDRKELDAAAREGKVRVRVDLQEGGTRWVRDLPEDLTSITDGDEDVTDEYPDLLKRVKELAGRRSWLRKQLSHYEDLKCVMDSLTPETVVNTSTTGETAMTVELQRTKTLADRAALAVQRNAPKLVERKRTAQESVADPGEDGLPSKRLAASSTFHTSPTEALLEVFAEVDAPGQAV